MAVNGLEAIEIAKTELPDIIIMDIRMPVMNGWEAMRIIKKDPVLMKIPIIALTAAAFNTDEQKANNEGFDAYMFKPVHMADLVAVLGKFIKGIHKIIEKEQIKEQVNINDFVAKSKDELFRTIDEMLMPMWVSFGNIYSKSQVNEFASKLNEIGIRHNVQALSSYSKKLSKASGSYNIDQIKSLILDFPLLVDDINKVNK
jgi:two-component system sensor histidine kinase EvgS